MTAKPGSPVRRRKPKLEHRICGQCSKAFKPRRSDATFCSDRCRKAANRKSPSLGVARVAFPTGMQQAELATAATVSWLNERSVPLGVLFTHTKRTFDVRDLVSGSGAVDRIEKHDQGYIGQFLRALRTRGHFSPSPVVREALTEHIHRRRNLAILSDTKAVLDRDNEEWRRISELKRAQTSILNGDAYIERAIRPLPEHKGISIGAPSIMPSPASDGGPKAADPMPPRKTSKRWRHG